jgi:hypothetical protein
MKKRDKLIKVYTGTEVTVLALKGFLEEIEVNSVVQNNYRSGLEAGYFGDVQSAIDLYIQISDFEKAEPVIRNFVANNKK